MELKSYFTQDDQGNVMPSAVCYLYHRGAENLAEGLQSATAMPLANPFQADSLGLIQIAAPNGLYDLRVTSGKRDYRFSVQFNDVNDDLVAAKKAAARAEVARDQVLLEANIATNIADGLSKTTEGQAFQVLGESANDYLVLYRNLAGQAVEQRRYPTTAAIEAMRSLVQPLTPGATDPEYLRIMDDESNRVAYLTDRRLNTPGFDIALDESATLLGDSEGGALIYADQQSTVIGGLEMWHTSLPGIFVVDDLGCVLQELSKVDEAATSTTTVSPFQDGLLFSPLIATCDVYQASIYPASLLARRELVTDVVATVASTTTSAAVSGEALPISASKFGTAPVLSVRSKEDTADRRFMTLNLKHVPVQSTAKAVNILYIGDSIGNREGLKLLGEYLAQLNVTATFIGTLNSSSLPGSGNDANGPLGECREGWESGDYTYAVTDRVSIIQPGGESAYQALAKANKWTINPFLRVATAADPALIVRNGYVFDCAYYQSRFGFPVPDIVINALGTNDIRDRSAATIYDVVYANDLIIQGQIRKAWPAAKIIRTLPGTAINTVRNTIWTQLYVPTLRAIQKAAADLADPSTVIAPVWAMTNAEGAYQLPATAAGADGFISGDWADPVHPIGASRHSLYQALTPFVAAAAINLI